MTSLKKIFSTITCFLALLLSSCILNTSINTGSKSVTYVDGNYSINVKGNYKDIYKATLKVINEDNDFILASKYFDPSNEDAYIEGVTKIDSKNFDVSIEKITEQITKVTIKIGTGEKDKSSKLMNEIQNTIQKNL
ncbi:MAG: DUF3568 domain-containing protein [Francisella sp.]